MSEADIEQLIGEVARKHGLLLSRDDPVLVSVTLNELLLADALGQLRASLDTAKQEIGELSAKQTEAAKTIAEQLITAAAGYIADEVRAACRVSIAPWRAPRSWLRASQSFWSRSSRRARSDYLARHICFFRHKASGGGEPSRRETDPPAWLARIILA